MSHKSFNIKLKLNLIELAISIKQDVIFPFLCTAGSITISQRLYFSLTPDCRPEENCEPYCRATRDACFAATLAKRLSSGSSRERSIESEKGAAAHPLGGVHTDRKREEGATRAAKEGRTLHFYWHITSAAPRHCKQASKPSSGDRGYVPTEVAG